MKRLLALTFLLTMIPTTQSVAAMTAKCTIIHDMDECDDTPGCQVVTTGLGSLCKPCSDGYYGTDCENSCLYDAVLQNIKDGIPLAPISNEYARPTQTDCRWTINCPAGYRWGGLDLGCRKCSDNTISQYETEVEYIDTGYGGYKITPKEPTTCNACGKNASANHYKNACICNSGYKDPNSQPGTPSDNVSYGVDCVKMDITDYKIQEYTLHLNRPWVTTNGEIDNVVYYLYVRDTVDTTDWVISITRNDAPTHEWLENNKINTAPEALFANRNKDPINGNPYTIKRYIRTSYGMIPELDNCDLPEFEGFGLSPNTTPGKPDIPEGDKLYLCWTYKSYTVEYYMNESDPAPVYTDNTPSYKDDNRHDAASTNNKNIPWPAGKIATEWKCIENCDSTAYDLGDQVLPSDKSYVSNNSVVKLLLQVDECPEGNYCRDNIQNKCSNGSYCPKGSETEEKCPAGYYCETPATKDECTTTGSYCPEGSTEPTNCPAGYYCETPATKDECPAGSYCPQDSTAPKDCPLGYYCPSTTGGVCTTENNQNTTCVPPDDSKCPVGLTTDKIGATAKTQCGITSATKFKEKNSKATFSLPLGDDGFLSYKGQTNSI